MKSPYPDGVEEDGDEVFTPMPTHCQAFYCNTDAFGPTGMDAGETKRLGPPPLVRNKDGFMVCPRCGSSYGRG